MMNFDDLRQTEHYVALAEAALRDLSNAQSITAAETVVSRSREDALIEQLQTAKADVIRTRAMLAQATLDGDPELIGLVRGHLDRKTTDYNALYAAVRAELVQIKRAQITAYTEIALRRQVLDAACDAAVESASRL
jgi:hypothetical protein